MFDFIAQLLYPKRCVRCGKRGDYICDTCFAGIAFLEHQLCGVCQKGSIDGMTHPKCRTRYGIDGIFSAIKYKGIVKKLLYQFKYPPYLSDLKGILGRLLYEGVIQEEAFVKISLDTRVFIVPVPLHTARERKRGYNQAELLARDFSYRLKTPFLSVLERSKMTKPQFDLRKEERIRNVIDAFSVKENFKRRLSGATVILIDDITTTGATLRECAKVLKKSGVKKVIGTTLAHEG